MGNIKRIGALLALFMAFIGAVCGVGYIVAYAELSEKMTAGDAVVPVVGVLVLDVLAWPSVCKLWGVLNNDCGNEND